MQPNGFVSALRRILGPRAPKEAPKLKAPVLPRVVPDHCPLLDPAFVALTRPFRLTIRVLGMICLDSCSARASVRR